MHACRNIAIHYSGECFFHNFVPGGLNVNTFLQVEVWMQTFAPNSGTPIHRHACEEVFITLKGSGTLYLAPKSQLGSPGQPQELPIYPNSTFTIPVDGVHQVCYCFCDWDF